MRTVALRLPNWLAAACCALVVAGCPGDGGGGEDTSSEDTASEDADATDTAVPDDTVPADTAEDTGADDTGPVDTAEDTAGDDTAVADTAEDTGPQDTLDGWTPPRCGDGVKDFGEACDDGDAENSDTLPDHCRTDCTAARCGDGVEDSGETCDDGNDNDFDGCTTLCEPSTAVATPGVGELVVTELMIDPDAVGDIHGEWIELYNAADVTLNVAGCVVHDDGTDAFTLTGEGGGLLLAPGDLLVLAPDGDVAANGGVDVDVVYATMLLDNVADEVVVTCGGVEVDRVAWTALGWGLVSGQSLSLDPTRVDAASNDDVASWCNGVVRFGDGDLGTPGSENPPCFQLDTTVDRCVLTMPAGTTGYTDYPVTVTVAVGEFGVTDLTSGVDVSPNLLVELGHGPPGTHPAAAVWTWLAGEPTPGWVGDAERLDGYERGLVFATPTVRDVAARASRDGGATWCYCDRDPGAEDGYSVADAASVTVIQTPCQPDSCQTPDAAVCAADGVRVETFEPEGACVPTAVDAFDCVYAPRVVDCGASGRVCDGGACGALASAPDAPGEVVVSELLVRPAAVDATLGQWIELTNHADRPLDLGGCTLTATPTAGSDPVSWTFPGSLVLPTGRREVVGASADAGVNGGAPVGMAWGEGFALPTSAFELALGCGDVVIDAVPFGTGTGWPSSLGAAASLSPYRTDAADNDLSASWCVATETFGVGDRGTPGGENPACTGDVVPVDSCWLLGDATLAARSGVEVDVVVRVIEQGITNKSVRTDVSAKLLVEVGHGPAGARPGDADWSWFSASPDTTWYASVVVGTSLAEDRYFLRLVAPAPGTRDLLARVTADGGNTWSLCDLDAIVAPGEEPTPQQLVSTASACYPDPCGDSPGHVCADLAQGEAGPPTVVLDLRSPAVCTLDDADAAVCTWIEDVVEDCSEVGAECQAGACANFPRTPGPGDAVISELVIVPSTGENGEWLEISNPGGAPLDLTGCRLESGPDEVWAWPAPEGPTDAVIAPGTALTVARHALSSINGGAGPREVMTGISLANAADWVALMCDDVVVDLVAWNIEDDWVIPTGQALSLAGNRLDAALNDFPAWWCPVGATSPNALNPLCPPPDTTLDDCVVVDPAGLTVDAGTAFAVSGRLYDIGVTDVRAGADPAPGTLGQVGFGPSGSDPVGSDWRWFSASADLGWSDGPAPGWDQWTASATLETPGTYATAFRFSADDGASWRYCDRDGDGYEPAAEGAVTVEPGVCVPNPCAVAPANTCSGAILYGSVTPGTCAVDGQTGEAVCTYGTVLFSCTSYGGCSAETGTCGQPPVTAQPGDLVINEIMRDSVVTQPDKGEWIELHNLTDSAIDLRGCEISDDDAQAFTVDGPVPIVVPANGYYLLATSKTTAENGTLSYVGWAWGDAYALANTSQTIVVRCGGAEIDRVSYAWDWPSRTGYAMQLHNGADGTQNDDPAWWCEASSVYGGGNRGTPRAVNKVCQGVPE
ncbi:MAG: hypothetical protein EP329_20275 [Deltaproteobacteria bacterium]|nr:MAG: hypothetical protein EP329_20275 [Deltaproteobacteria bacterium]